MWLPTIICDVSDQYFCFLKLDRLTYATSLTVRYIIFVNRNCFSLHGRGQRGRNHGNQGEFNKSSPVKDVGGDHHADTVYAKSTGGLLPVPHRYYRSDPDDELCGKRPAFGQSGLQHLRPAGGGDVQHRVRAMRRELLPNRPEQLPAWPRERDRHGGQRKHPRDDAGRFRRRRFRGRSAIQDGSLWGQNHAAMRL